MLIASLCDCSSATVLIYISNKNVEHHIKLPEVASASDSYLPKVNHPFNNSVQHLVDLVFLSLHV